MVDTAEPRTSAPSAVHTALLVVAVLSSGTLAGFFLAYGFTIMPGLATTDDEVFVEAFQGLERMFGTFEYGVNWPVILGYLGGPVVVAVMIFLHRRPGPLRSWLIAAFGLTIATIAITQIVNVPLNEGITAAGDPAGSGATRVRADFREDWWRAWNLVRAGTAVAASACLTWALLLHGRATARSTTLRRATPTSTVPSSTRRNAPF